MIASKQNEEEEKYLFVLIVQQIKVITNNYDFEPQRMCLIRWSLISRSVKEMHKYMDDCTCFLFQTRFCLNRDEFDIIRNRMDSISYLDEWMISLWKVFVPVSHSQQQSIEMKTKWKKMIRNKMSVDRSLVIMEFYFSFFGHEIFTSNSCAPYVRCRRGAVKYAVTLSLCNEK